MAAINRRKRQHDMIPWINAWLLKNCFIYIIYIIHAIFFIDTDKPILFILQ